jgi:hypothetical protein
MIIVEKSHQGRRRSERERKDKKNNFRSPIRSRGRGQKNLLAQLWLRGLRLFDEDKGDRDGTGNQGQERRRGYLCIYKIWRERDKELAALIEIRSHLYGKYYNETMVRCRGFFVPNDISDVLQKTPCWADAQNL